MKRIEFTFTGSDGEPPREPVFVENFRDHPVAIMQAMEDYLEANDGEPRLPLTIQVRPSRGTSTC